INGDGGPASLAKSGEGGRFYGDCGGGCGGQGKSRSSGGGCGDYG
ncbi:hypothetical protein Tco_0420590, partial [Tanacetum coccineum]